MTHFTTGNVKNQHGFCVFPTKRTLSGEENGPENLCWLFNPPEPGGPGAVRGCDGRRQCALIIFTLTMCADREQANGGRCRMGVHFITLERFRRVETDERVLLGPVCTAGAAGPNQPRLFTPFSVQSCRKRCDRSKVAVVHTPVSHFLEKTAAPL